MAVRSGIASKLSLATETTYAAIVGQVLVVLRQQKDVRQADLAVAVGVSQPTWSRIEAGATVLDVEQLGLAAAALGTTPVDFLAKVDDSIAGLEGEGIKVRRGPDAAKKAAKNVALALVGAAALGLLVARILRR